MASGASNPVGPGQSRSKATVPTRSWADFRLQGIRALVEAKKLLSVRARQSEETTCRGSTRPAGLLEDSTGQCRVVSGMGRKQGAGISSP